MAERRLFPALNFNISEKYMHFITGLLAAGLLFVATAVSAEPDLESLYVNPEGKNRSEAIIFYNSANPCENCPRAIDMLIAVLKANYRGILHAYLINAEQHPEFIRAFKLNAPLELVLVRISDGASFGYAKLGGLQNEINDPHAFESLVTEKINNFLSVSPKN